MKSSGKLVVVKVLINDSLEREIIEQKASKRSKDEQKAPLPGN